MNNLCEPQLRPNPHHPNHLPKSAKQKNKVRVLQAFTQKLLGKLQKPFVEQTQSNNLTNKSRNNYRST